MSFKSWIRSPFSSKRMEPLLSAPSQIQLNAVAVVLGMKLTDVENNVV